MKTRLPPSLVLIAVLLAACSPASAPSQPSAESVVIAPTATPFSSEAPAQIPPTQDPGVAQPPTPTPLPVATSRGPDLHATDPSTVSLASGQYQLVEFFRFT